MALSYLHYLSNLDFQRNLPVTRIISGTFIPVDDARSGVDSPETSSARDGALNDCDALLLSLEVTAQRAKDMLEAYDTSFQEILSEMSDAEL